MDNTKNFMSGGVLGSVIKFAIPVFESLRNRYIIYLNFVLLHRIL